MQSLNGREAFAAVMSSYIACYNGEVAPFSEHDLDMMRNALIKKPEVIHAYGKWCDCLMLILYLHSEIRKYAMRAAWLGSQWVQIQLVNDTTEDSISLQSIAEKFLQQIEGSLKALLPHHAALKAISELLSVYLLSPVNPQLDCLDYQLEACQKLLENDTEQAERLKLHFDDESYHQLKTAIKSDTDSFAPNMQEIINVLGAAVEVQSQPPAQPE